MLEFLCPSCRKRLRVDEGLAGKQGRCPVCRGTITIPQPSQALKPAAAGPTEEDEMPLPTEVLISPQMGTPLKPAPAPRPAAPSPSPQPAPAAKAPATSATKDAKPPSSLAKKLLLVAIPIIVIVAGIIVWYCCLR